MARIDDYENAFKLAAEALRQKKPENIAGSSGILFEPDPESPGKGLFTIDFIGRPHRVSCPDYQIVEASSGEDIPVTEKVIILHYLDSAAGVALRNELITYREIPAGEFYYAAFVKRAEIPLLKAFGLDPDRLKDVAPKIGGEILDGQADAVVRFQALPRVPITLMLWGGDDEFEPSGKILFDRSIQHYLSTEDVAVLSGMIIYRLMKLQRRHGANGGLDHEIRGKRKRRRRQNHVFGDSGQNILVQR